MRAQAGFLLPGEGGSQVLMLSRAPPPLALLARPLSRTGRLHRQAGQGDHPASSLSARPAGGEAAWQSALATYTDRPSPRPGGDDPGPGRPLPTLDDGHPGSIVRCLDVAQQCPRRAGSAHAQTWTAINRAWLLSQNVGHREPPRRSRCWSRSRGSETRGFRGAVIHRMMRNRATLLHPARGGDRAGGQHRAAGRRQSITCSFRRTEEVGSVVDRDQWNTILQTVSAVNAIADTDGAPAGPM